MDFTEYVLSLFHQLYVLFLLFLRSGIPFRRLEIFPYGACISSAVSSIPDILGLSFQLGVKYAHRIALR